MSVKMSVKMSAENPILGTQGYFVSRELNFRYTTIFLKEMKENYRNDTQSYRKHPRIPQNQKSQKILGSRGPGPFLRFHTRILIENGHSFSNSFSYKA